jgi:hypothetical protein
MDEIDAVQNRNSTTAKDSEVLAPPEPLHVITSGSASAVSSAKSAKAIAQEAQRRLMENLKAERDAERAASRTNTDEDADISMFLQETTRVPEPSVSDSPLKKTHSSDSSSTVPMSTHQVQLAADDDDDIAQFLREDEKREPEDDSSFSGSRRQSDTEDHDAISLGAFGVATFDEFSTQTECTFLS